MVALIEKCNMEVEQMRLFLGKFSNNYPEQIEKGIMLLGMKIAVGMAV